MIRVPVQGGKAGAIFAPANGANRFSPPPGTSKSCGSLLPCLIVVKDREDGRSASGHQRVGGPQFDQLTPDLSKLRIARQNGNLQIIPEESSSPRNGTLIVSRPFLGPRTHRVQPGTDSLMSQLERKSHLNCGLRLCQLGWQTGIDFAGWHEDPGIDEKKMGDLDPGKGVDLVSPADTEAGPADEEEGDIGPKTTGEAEELSERQVELPELEQSEQGHRCIAAAATKSGGRGDAFDDLDAHATVDSCRFAKKTGCFPYQIPLIGRHIWMITMNRNVMVKKAEMESISQIDRLKNGPQFVIAIRTTSEDLERPVDLRVRLECKHHVTSRLPGLEPDILLCQEFRSGVDRQLWRAPHGIVGRVPVNDTVGDTDRGLLEPGICEEWGKVPPLDAGIEQCAGQRQHCP